MKSRLVLALILLAVIASVFVVTGYAYSSSTENSGNTVSSQYVVLTQQNYTFGSTDYGFDIIDTEVGRKYQLVGGYTPLTEINGSIYAGVLIGSDKLTATVTGFDDRYLPIEISSWKIDETWITDFSDDIYGWRYVLKVTASGYEDQYAYFDGHIDALTDSSTWKVKDSTIGDSYVVNARDANDGGYIVLYGSHNPEGNYSVIKVKGGVPTLISGKKEGEPVNDGGSSVRGWKVNGKTITGDTYQVNPLDADAGGFIVLYDYDVSSDYLVIKVNGNDVSCESKTHGASVDEVSGWNVGGGSKLKIWSGVEYTTQLYFAGNGGNSGTSLRSGGITIKAPSQITLMPAWTPVTQDDIRSGEYFKSILEAGTGGIESNRVIYFKAESEGILPENVFTNSNPLMKFVGWKPSTTSTIYGPWHKYPANVDGRTFTAQWDLESNCYTVTFDPNGGKGTMDTAYLLKTDVGSTYTLPLCSFTKPGYVFTGWLVTGSEVYSGYTDPYTDIAAVKESLNVKAQWAELPSGSKSVSISFGSNTVIKVDRSGVASVLSGLHIGDTVANVNGWYVNGKQITSTDYKLKESDVGYGEYIIIYQTAVDSGYAVVKVEGESASTVSKIAGEKVEGVTGWKVRGTLIYGGVYTVNATDANTGGYILLYANAAAAYTLYTDTKGNITLPYCMVSPPESLSLHGFEGWIFKGWSVISTLGKTVAQSYTMPMGIDGYVMKNSTIKFSFSNDLQNGEEIA